MKNTKIKISFITIIVVVLLSSSAFAATFSDLSDATWAVPYINKMADLGIISGYLGKFNPNDNLSKYAALSTIYRTLDSAGKLEGESISVYKAKYASVMTSNNVPDWAGLKEAVAFCLEKKIIQEDELRTFMIGDEHQNATRNEVSVYLGKALNLYLKENINTIISLDFKDSNMITTASAPYVNMLVKKGIINGTPEGYFKPYDKITRAAMTKMLSDSYDLLKSLKVVELKYSNGTINYVMDDGNKIIVTLDGYVDSKIYTIGTDVKIYKDDVQKSVSFLTKDQSIKLGFDGDSLYRIDLLTESEDISGELRLVDDRNGYFQIEIYDENDDNDRKSYTTVGGLSTGTLDGESVKLSEITRGDYAKLTLDENDKVIQIIAESKYQRYEGILKSNITFDGVPEIKVQLDSNEIQTFELNEEDVDIERNDDNAEIADLVIGDYVSIKTAYGKIVEISAVSMKQENVDGTIVSVLIANVPIITVVDDGGVEKSYKLHQNAVIEIDNDDAEYYDLRVGYTVEMEVDGTVISQIDAKAKSSSDQLSGTISTVYSDLSIISIKTNVAQKTEYISVTYNSSTEFVDVQGEKLRVSALEEGDTVFVTGSYRDSFFTAEKIIVLDN